MISLSLSIPKFITNTLHSNLWTFTSLSTIVAEIQSEEEEQEKRKESEITYRNQNQVHINRNLRDGIFIFIHSSS